MKIGEILKKDFILAELQSNSKTDALWELSEYLERSGVVKDKTTLFAALMEREKLCSTGIGENVAIPHSTIKEINQIIALFGRSTKGIDFESLDRKPVYFICLILVPQSSTGQHLKAMTRISRLFKSQDFRDRILNAKNTVEIYSLLISEDSKFI